MLRFHLGDVPVGVHFSFLLIAFLGPGRELWQIGAWTVAVFIAVLAHEAGHAFVARAYGARPVAITLFALGGVTTYPARRDLTPGRRFVIAAAGSAVGIVLGGAVGLMWLGGWFEDGSRLVRLFALSFIWAALFWGVLNWIPIRPLDGGQMLTSALQIFWPDRGADIARGISVVAGIAVAVIAWQLDLTFLAVFVLFIMFVGLRRDPEEAFPDAAADQADPTDHGGHRDHPGPVSPAPPNPRDADGETPPPAFPI